MNTFQSVVIPFALLLAVFELTAWARGGKRIGFLRSMVWLCFAVAVYLPDSVQHLKSFASIGRAADLLLYGLAVFVLLTTCYFLNQFESQRRQLTLLVRKFATLRVQWHDSQVPKNWVPIGLASVFAVLLGFEPTNMGLATVDLADKQQADVERLRSMTPQGWPQLYGPSRTSMADETIKSPQFDSIGVETLWQIPVGTGYGSPVVFEDYIVFNHRKGDEDIVQCVATTTGESRWEYRTATTFNCKFEYSSGPYSTPVIDRGQVFCIGGQGHLACLDLLTGSLIWKRELLEEFDVEDTLFPFGSSPLVVDDKLICNVGSTLDNAGIVAFDLVTGETKWQATDHGVAYCMPVATTIHQQSFLFVITKEGLVCLHPETGKVDWEVEHHARTPMSYNAVSPLVYKDCVLIVTGPGPGAICLQLQPDRSYKELWHDRKVLDSQFNVLMSSSGCVFGFTAGLQRAELRCVEILTGQLKWSYSSAIKRGQGLIAGDSIVLIGEEGHLAVLKCSTGEATPVYSSPEAIFESPCYCSPAICKDGLLIKNEKHLRLIRCWPTTKAPGSFDDSRESFYAGRGE